MLDIKFIRENPEKVKEAIRVKNIDLDLDELLKKDREVVEWKKSLESLQAERNANAKNVAKSSPTERSLLIEKGRELVAKIDQIKPLLQEGESKLQEFLWLVPNIPASDVPIGKDESGNVEIKKWGNIPQFSFTPLNHVDILHKRNWADLERIANVCGSRTYALKNELVFLEMALLQFALAKLVKNGFQLISVPALVKEFALYGTGHFPTGREQVYHLSKDDLYLSGTAEVPINSLHSKEILQESDLPLLYGGISPCFRREAGSAGKDVRGLIRVHQFMKVEQFILCKNDPKEAAKWHQKILQISEEIVQELGLPYRVVECCTGDMGAGKVKMYDIESWVPSENRYRETHSCSSLHDWQARRSDLRYRDEKGVVQYCYTLNNTAIASPRILVPFLENHQLQDGSIKIPEPLRPYLNSREVL